MKSETKQIPTKKTRSGKSKEVKKKAFFDEGTINASSAVRSTFQTLEGDLKKVIPVEFKGKSLGVLPQSVDELPHTICLETPHYDDPIYWVDTISIKIFVNEGSGGKLSKSHPIKFIVV